MKKQPIRVLVGGLRPGVMDRVPTEVKNGDRMVKLWRFHPDNGFPSVYLPASAFEAAPSTEPSAGNDGGQDI